MTNKILIFSFLYAGIWLSTLLLNYNPDLKITYFFFFEFILIYFLYISMSHKLAMLLSLSTFIYFYQVPLMDFFPHEKLGVYDFKLDISMQFEAYSIYNTVLGSIFIILYYLIKEVNFKDIVNSLQKEKFLTYIFYSASILSIVLLLYAIFRAGGLNAYLILNKFEATAIQKFIFFTYKDFASIAIVSGLISNNKKITYLTYFLIIIYVGFEILSAKRIMILIVAINIFLYKMKDFKGRYFFYIFSAIFIMTLVKFIYYNIRLYVLGESTFYDIFWFNWGDVFFDTIFMHEGRAHIELLLSYLYHDISFQPIYILKQLIISIPFGHNIIEQYQTAGEYLRIYLNEPWIGLASSQYIVPYLSVGFFGIIIIYLLQLIIIASFNFFIQKINYQFIKLWFLINIPIILFYSHREEIILITKSVFISSSALTIVYIVAILLSFNKIILQKTTMKNSNKRKKNEIQKSSKPGI